MAQTTDKQVVRTFVSLCVGHGVENVVLSPGSRNAPLIIAFNREEKISCQIIVDERSAAFFALGMAQKSRKPVVLVCTSGTALLNYAPAVAEAYYQRIPLIVVSADRPDSWIDQNDSQTIRQFNALQNFVKKSYHIADGIITEEKRWFMNRTVNDAFLTALAGRKAPVHINISLNEPLYRTGEFSLQERTIQYIGPEQLENKTLQSFAKQLNESKKVMILVGFMHNTKPLQLLLNEFSRFSSIVVLAELTANLSFADTITEVEMIFGSISEEEIPDFRPELLISFGGALVSKSAKRFLRQNPPTAHWHIGTEENTIDTFKCLSRWINMNPEVFFTQLLPLLKPERGDYQTFFKKREEALQAQQTQWLQLSGWNDLKVFSLLMQAIPENSDLHLSNGTSIRLAQRFRLPQSVRVYANRGTSGIDGSTSTAVGYAFLNQNITTLISGDLSFLYDSNALWNNYLSPRLKMVVINNGGGGIFRNMDGLPELPERYAYFETPHHIDFEKLAALYNLTFLRATDETMLMASLEKLYSENNTPIILEIVIP